ncbi:MAG: DNA repair protein RadC [Bacteroidota bacterium]
MLEYYSSSHWTLQESLPYRIAHLGLESLSDRELIGLIINDQEKAVDLCSQYPSLLNLLQADQTELINLHNLSERQATLLCLYMTLHHRIKQRQQVPSSFTNSSEVGGYLQAKYAHVKREVFSVLYLNRNMELIADEKVFIGGVSGVIVDPKIIFKKAVHHLASALVVCHNHPSGNLKPSKEDVALTQNLVDAALLFDIHIIDHIIVSSQGYFSFADEGLL